MDAVIFCDIKEKKTTKLSDKAPSNNIVLYFLSRIQHIKYIHTHAHEHSHIHIHLKEIQATWADNASKRTTENRQRNFLHVLQ